MESVVYIYTDGACRGNPGPGGWGVLLRYGDTEKQFSGSDKNTTNNRMELTAAIEALAVLEQPREIVLSTDSEYLRKGITEWIIKWKRNGWRTAQRQPVKNIDLWQRLDKQAMRHDISWHWVKGHAGDPGNECADRLATSAIE